MISKITIKNYRSIIETTLDLSFAEGKAPNGYKQLDTLPFLEDDKKNRVVPVAVLYGPNASGKSNIIKALNDFNFLLAKGVYNGLFHPNLLNAKTDETTIEMHGFEDGMSFCYSISYNDRQITKESLSIDSVELLTQNNGVVEFSRKISNSEIYTQERLKEIVHTECFRGDVQLFPIFSKFVLNYSNINPYLQKVFSNIIMFVLLSNNTRLDDILNMVYPNLNQEELQDLMKRALSLLCKMDIGIKDLKYSIDNSDSRNINHQNFRTMHVDSNGKEVWFDLFKDESMGSQLLISMLVQMLYVLDHGFTLVVDELDKSLHSLVLCEIVKLFKDKNYNKKNAQLIFTAHNTDILDTDILRVSEVNILNKNLKQGTTITRLSDFENIRNDTNFRKQYLDGVFSGIPFPYI